MKAKKSGRIKKDVVSDNFSVMESAIDLSMQEKYLKFEKQ
jgi:hypothetical protein